MEFFLVKVGKTKLTNAASCFGALERWPCAPTGARAACSVVARARTSMLSGAPCGRPASDDRARSPDPPSTAATPQRHAPRARWPLPCGTTHIPMTSSPWQASRPDPPRPVPLGQSEGPPPSSSSLYKIPPLFPPARACHRCVVVAMVTSTVSSRSRATTDRLSTPPPP
jgi:hypothetical protein